MSQMLKGVRSNAPAAGWVERQSRAASSALMDPPELIPTNPQAGEGGNAVAQRCGNVATAGGAVSCCLRCFPDARSRVTTLRACDDYRALGNAGQALRRPRTQYQASRSARRSPTWRPCSCSSSLTRRPTQATGKPRRCPAAHILTPAEDARPRWCHPAGTMPGS
jgi:hypothetical protein